MQYCGIGSPGGVFQHPVPLTESSGMFPCSSAVSSTNVLNVDPVGRPLSSSAMLYWLPLLIRSPFDQGGPPTIARMAPVDDSIDTDRGGDALRGGVGRVGRAQGRVVGDLGTRLERRDRSSPGSGGHRRTPREALVVGVAQRLVELGVLLDVEQLVLHRVGEVAVGRGLFDVAARSAASVRRRRCSARSAASSCRSRRARPGR